MKIRIRFNQERGFLSLLGIVASLIIVCILLYLLLNTYFKKTVPDKRIGIGVTAPNIDTSSYKSIVDSTKNTVENINKQREAQLDEFMKKE